MGKFGVRDDTERALLARMERVGLREEDIVEKFIRGSGKGGQKINRSSSCVVLSHLPSGLEVRCQKERSQALNRFFARRILCEKLERLVLGEQSAAAREQSKVRRQKARRSRRTKQKMLADKRAHADKKSLRARVIDS